MQNVKPVSTPLAAHFKLSTTLSPKTYYEHDYMSRVPYSIAVGPLMYTMETMTSYVFTIGGCNKSWKATLQTTVALSTTETEYMAITEALMKAIWLEGPFCEPSKVL
ncbi:hypothetical protein CQW23_30766 [Capsicum baccatum]|uniref:Retrovirus-related Pol polyprotein from transposon TNT 1-94 n=1 Tax=Capsicum baccatum TaxID=33114 RepID=A0A2G2V9H8_CAPBA|nr:hypothetical protein CQW23_30766 [Capsicum baccatum]